MKTISSALATHLAGDTTTIATCWLVSWQRDGASVGTFKAYTDHDQDLAFDLEAALTARGLPVPPAFVGSGSQTYLAASGYTASDVQTSAALNVDDLELEGLIQSGSILEADLTAGRWDNAGVIIFQVNWADLSQGALVLRVGNLGEVTLRGLRFVAELRGLLELYRRGVVALSTPSCRYVLGDAFCTKNLAAFTHNGTLTGVNSDNMTLYDTARAEAGPSGGKTISGITQATNGVVTTTTAHGFSKGQVVTIRSVLGMTPVNTVHAVRAVPSATTFTLSTDTSGYPAYTSGGTVTALGGADDGYFTYGLLTFNTGNNAGLSREIKSYAPGVLVLQEPMPFTCQVGDTYTAKAGCNKDLFTGCRDKFNNVVNFGGEPHVIGNDLMIQVARHS